jgi:hypothetical protein
MKDIKTATLQGITTMIGKIADESIANRTQASPQMLAAYEAVLSLIESKSRSSHMTDMLNKVRQAVGLSTQEPETEATVSTVSTESSVPSDSTTSSEKK